MCIKLALAYTPNSGTKYSTHVNRVYPKIYYFHSYLVDSKMYWFLLIAAT